MRKPSKSILRTVASNVVRLRAARGMSQEMLAESCGLHRTYVGSVERGERNLTISSLEVLARALQVSVPYLVADHTTKDSE